MDPILTDEAIQCVIERLANTQVSPSCDIDLVLDRVRSALASYLGKPIDDQVMATLNAAIESAFEEMNDY